MTLFHDSGPRAVMLVSQFSHEFELSTRVSLDSENLIFDFCIFGLGMKMSDIRDFTIAMAVSLVSPGTLITIIRFWFRDKTSELMMHLLFISLSECNTLNMAFFNFFLSRLYSENMFPPAVWES